MVFQKGQSGNPGGRPKSRLAALARELRKELRRLGPVADDGKNRDAMLARLIDIVLKGEDKDSVAAAKVLAPYTYGSPLQSIEIDLREHREAREMTEAELLEIAARGKDKTV